ncbi:MAG: LysM peptidoglycan-binding domain-containing protein [Anaerolineae bacterium]|nr:LysM peptidoglycan-binding domain-containing protein [Anaerolineae bacterium]
MAKKKEKQGIFNRAVDAVSSRDEKAAAEEAQKAAERAEATADRAQDRASEEAAKRRAAEAKVREAEKLAAAADAAKKAAQTEAFKAQIALKDAERRTRMAELTAQGLQERAEREAKAKARTYVVQPGDSLSKIAKQVLGDAGRWPEILEANKDQISNPNMIRVGQELRLP